MRDQINQIIEPGSFFLIPDGNPRYGGLKLKLGVVMHMTEKRCRTLITEINTYKPKPTTKTPSKLLVVNTDIFENLESFQKLKQAFLDSRESFK